MEMVKTKGGKMYAPVSERIKAYREKFPLGCITTNIYHCDFTHAIVTAEVYDDKNNLLGKASALEMKPTVEEVNRKVEAKKRRNAQYGKPNQYVDPETIDVNIINWLENAETSAVGRALSFAGFGGDGSIASFEEIVYNMQNDESLLNNPPLSQPLQSQPLQQEKPTDFQPQNYQQQSPPAAMPSQATPPAKKKSEPMNDRNAEIFRKAKEKNVQMYLDSIAGFYGVPSFKEASGQALNYISNLVSEFNRKQLIMVVTHAERLNFTIGQAIDDLTKRHGVVVNAFTDDMCNDYFSMNGVYENV